MSKGIVGLLEVEEENFWKDVIEMFLKLLDSDKKCEIMVNILLFVNFFWNYLDFMIDLVFFFVEFIDVGRFKRV